MAEPLIIPAPPPGLVDALGNPLREEPVATFSNSPEPEPLDIKDLVGIATAVKWSFPPPLFDKVARCPWLPVTNSETGELRHHYLDAERRILFLSPDAFEKVRAETP